MDKEAFLPSHKYLVDKTQLLHSNGKILRFPSIT